MQHYLTQQQTLLLQAIFLPEPQALDACQQWLMQVNIDGLDGESVRLLPQLYRKIMHYGLEHPGLPRIKGTYRYVWAKNQRWHSYIISLLQQLHQAQVPTLLLRDAAIVLGCYHDNGLRPARTLDFWVPTSRIPDAITCLQTSGWTQNPSEPQDGSAEESQREKMVYRFTNHDQHVCLLHSRFVPKFLSEETEAQCWKRAVPLSVQNISTSVLAPTDHLLQLCLQGIRAKRFFFPLWLSDMMMLLKMAEMKIDWERLLVQAELFHVVFPLRVGGSCAARNPDTA
jgi:hypothetical protein